MAKGKSKVKSTTPGSPASSISLHSHRTRQSTTSERAPGVVQNPPDAMATSKISFDEQVRGSGLAVIGTTPKEPEDALREHLPAAFPSQRSIICMLPVCDFGNAHRSFSWQVTQETEQQMDRDQVTAVTL